MAIVIAVVSASVVAMASGPLPPPALSGPPNVVLILADDLGWGDVRTNNPESAMSTERIDSIARDGVAFHDAHAPAAWCSPTRYGLLTGRYAWRIWPMRDGERVKMPEVTPLIKPGVPTLATMLRRYGYRTAIVGKWHVGMVFSSLPSHLTGGDDSGIDFDGEILDGPLDHGFDEFFGIESHRRHSQIYIRDRRFVGSTGAASGTGSLSFYAMNESLDRMTEEALSFIDRQSREGSRFFLYLPLHAPHYPTEPSVYFDGRTGLGNYADVVAQIDWNVGRVLDALRRNGMDENTLVIFASDNGSFVNGLPVPNHQWHLPNGGWRGGKYRIYEGGHRVPLLVRWPAHIPPGVAVNATVSLTDVYATVAEALGDEPAEPVPRDSISLMPLISGDADVRGVPVVHRSLNGTFAIRDGPWKLVLGTGHGGFRKEGRGEPFARPWRLYNLDEDPGELFNLIGDRPEVADRMADALRRLGAPVP